jgi:hypothetical protein
VRSRNCKSLLSIIRIALNKWRGINDNGLEVLIPRYVFKRTNRMESPRWRLEGGSRKRVS